jgi:hypothetical protein
MAGRANPLQAGSSRPQRLGPCSRFPDRKPAEAAMSLLDVEVAIETHRLQQPQDLL